MCKNKTKNSDAYARNKIRLRYIEVFATAISCLIALAAVILSIKSLSQSKEMLDYQIAQERLPRVVALNYEISNSFEVSDSDEIYSYDLINDLKIPVYNIGVGVAQNCEIRWNIESVKSACLKAKNTLENNVSIAEYDFSKDGLPSVLIYDYFFEYKDNRFKTIEFYDGSSNRHEIGFDENIIKIPYVLPITEQQTNEFINIPKSIAVFMLEYANHNINDSIDIELDITYEDIMGECFTKTYLISFSLAKRDEVENNDAFGNDTINCTFDMKISEKI